MIVKRQLALVAVAEEALWIAKNNPRAAEQFIQAVEITLKTLEFMPRAGHAYLRQDDRIQGIRMQPVRRYPTYLVFYRPLSTGIEFVWLVHGARDIASAMRMAGLL